MWQIMPYKLLFSYSLFALIATGINIAAQDIVTSYYTGAFDIVISVLVGTALGLLVKYALDKRYIFHFKTHGARENGHVFVRYVIMGLATTAVFWGFECIFHVIFQSKAMRYLGATIGLAIGYITKYQLDKRYVFQKVVQ